MSLAGEFRKALDRLGIQLDKTEDAVLKSAAQYLGSMHESSSDEEKCEWLGELIPELASFPFKDILMMELREALALGRLVDQKGSHRSSTNSNNIPGIPNGLQSTSSISKQTATDLSLILKNGGISDDSVEVFDETLLDYLIDTLSDESSDGHSWEALDEVRRIEAAKKLMLSFLPSLDDIPHTHVLAAERLRDAVSMKRVTIESGAAAVKSSLLKYPPMTDSCDGELTSRTESSAASLSSKFSGKSSTKDRAGVNNSKEESMVAVVESDSDAVDIDFLQSMCPTIDRDIIRYVYIVACSRNRVEAGNRLTECILEAEAEIEMGQSAALQRLKGEKAAYEKKLRETAAAEAAAKKRIKSQLVSKYGDQVVPPKYDSKGRETATKKAVIPTTVFMGATERESKVRYRDGVVASTKGEKIITLKNPADDYDGGSRGKVKLKGKRGPGWVNG